MTLRLLVKKLEAGNAKIITRDEIKSYCKSLKLDYYNVIGYLTSNNYVIRILRGIFYIKSAEERKLNKTNASFSELLKLALDIKKINNWYFGLESALKLNNITHEFFTVEIIINDSLSRPHHFDILGTKVKFIKIKKELLKFGVIEGVTRYSDLEKTLLDFIYLGKYNNYSDEEIKAKISDIIGRSDKKKLAAYARKYPKTVIKFLEKKWQKQD